MNHSERDRTYHDGVAGQYDRVVGQPREFPDSLLFEGFMALFGRRDRLLDLGCGTGHMLVRYAGAFRSAVGVDHSVGMLRQAQANIQRKDLQNVILVRADLFAFCSEAASTYDAITCVGVLHHLTGPGRQQLLKAMFNLCAPQGRVLLAEPLASNPAPAAVLEWNRRLRDRARQFEGRLPPDPNEAPLDEGRLRADIHSAGFEVIAENRMWEMSNSRAFPLAQEREAMRRLIGENPGGNVLALMLGKADREPDVRTVPEDKDALLARAEELAPSSPREAVQIFARVLALEHANLTAHNALERLGAPFRYGRWMHVNCIIDPRDDMFRFVAMQPSSTNPIRDYLADGWRTMSELMLLLERVDRPLLKMNSVLEFAAGFGRFTRHLTRVLPGRVACTDVHPGAVEFLREQFHVEAFDSSMDLTKVTLPTRYDLIFVLSLFTHLPVQRWSAWLQYLHRGLNPGGLLVFSVHNESVAKSEGVPFDHRGTHFVRSSESSHLDGNEYGTTFTTESFVIAQVELALGRQPLLYERLAFWVGQDAVVVSA